ncbi:MAG TPA: hypothetical protein VHV31_17185 [Nitrolancea sp.]|nr:hypothetical protein [Nitrolancea sp.]
MSENDLPVIVDDAGGEIENLGDTLKDIGQRLPNYAKLSYNLVSAGKMTSAEQNQLLGPLGYGPASKIARFVPLLNQLMRVLSMIGTIRYVLTQMDFETANEHLASVGLSREQVERDFTVTRDLAARAKDTGSREASRALATVDKEGARAIESGGRIAGRLTGKGIRSFRNWQARAAENRSNDDLDRS